MISIVNYGMGNIGSIKSALNYLKIENQVITHSNQIKLSDKIILPGVGSFAKAMENIRKMNLIDPLYEIIIIQKKPVLGICLGMQLFADSGDEHGPSKGLGYLHGKVQKLSVGNSMKLPHIGFNSANFVFSNNSLFKGLGENSDFYFVHNYKFVCDNVDNVSSFTMYGENFASSVCQDNVFGVQFHPEKSQSNGLIVLKNFAAI